MFIVNCQVAPVILQYTQCNTVDPAMCAYTCMILELIYWFVQAVQHVHVTLLHKNDNGRENFQCTGGFPYPTIPNQDLLTMLKQGHRLEKPDNCAPEV